MSPINSSLAGSWFPKFSRLSRDFYHSTNTWRQISLFVLLSSTKKNYSCIRGYLISIIDPLTGSKDKTHKYKFMGLIWKNFRDGSWISLFVLLSSTKKNYFVTTCIIRGYLISIIDSLTGSKNKTHKFNLNFGRIFGMDLEFHYSFSFLHFNEEELFYQDVYSRIFNFHY